MKRLTVTEKILCAVLGILLVRAGIAWWETATPTLQVRKTTAAAIASTDLVDQSTYAQSGQAFSGTLGVNVKPVVGGVEIAVRYITRANERYVVRDKLYHQAVNLLGAKPLEPGSK